jgi:hypothetical protein
VHGDTREQGPLASEAVGERADHQLAEAEAEQGSGQRQLHGGIGGEQLAGDRRERGEVQVDGQRAERDERAEHQDQPEAIPPGVRYSLWDTSGSQRH